MLDTWTVDKFYGKYPLLSCRKTHQALSSVSLVLEQNKLKHIIVQKKEKKKDKKLEHGAPNATNSSACSLGLVFCSKSSTSA